MLNHDENQVLRDALSGLNADVPPMPEDIHAAWMQKVEDDMEPQTYQKSSRRKAWSRILSTAAALVFVIGGTLLTRDDLERRLEYDRLVAENTSLTSRCATTDEYLADLKTYEAAQSSGSSLMGTAMANYMPAPEAAEEDVMVYSTARGVSMDAGVTDDAIASAQSASEKKIIRTASLTIMTQTFEESLASLKATCEAGGGWLESSAQSTNNSTGLRTAYLTLRVPQSGLDSYLAGAQALGRITQRSESATDVTESYQDTQARLETQQALMARLQTLITESADLSDLLALESQIADTQYTIDRLQSSLNSTDRQVTYSTIDVTLREETTPALTDTTVSLGDRLMGAISLGWETLTGFVADMAVFLTAALPFIGIVVIVYVAGKLILKIRRKK
ncbi:MAG: DUF4349 domain-containing protein [Clostridia bacterium]|nr:DUF4349 domain-containing protein [Clostridia bacterium]